MMRVWPGYCGGQATDKDSLGPHRKPKHNGTSKQRTALREISGAAHQHGK